MLRLWTMMMAALLSSTVVAEGVNFRDAQLSLADKARACYVWFKLYDASYYRSADGQSRCVRLDYLREFSAADLDKATRDVFEDLHGQQLAVAAESELGRTGEAYRAVAPGDSYKYCVDAKGGEMLRDGEVAVAFEDVDFAERFLDIWVKGEESGKPVWQFKVCRA